MDIKKFLLKQLPPGSVVEQMEGGLFLHLPAYNLEQVYVEVTTRCNLNCITCIRRSWPEKVEDMDMEVFNNLIEQLKDFPRLSHIILGGFGEPLMHPHIVEMVTKAKSLGVKVKITTNATLLKNDLAKELVDSKLDEIIFSCDSVDSTKFSQIRKYGDLEEIMKNIDEINRIKQEKGTVFPLLGLEFVLMKKNKEQLPYLSDLARKLQLSSVLITNLLPYTDDMKDEILYTGEFDPLPPQQWINPAGGFIVMSSVNFPQMKWGATRRCRFIEKRSVSITSDGSVSPCYPLMHTYDCFVFGRKKTIQRYTLGNIVKKKLSDIWISEEYLKFRNRVHLFNFPSCVDCDLNASCDYPALNEDCWGNKPSCADCLWAQDIIRCP